MKKVTLTITDRAKVANEVVSILQNECGYDIEGNIDPQVLYATILDNIVMNPIWDTDYVYGNKPEPDIAVTRTVEFNPNIKTDVDLMTYLSHADHRKYFTALTGSSNDKEFGLFTMTTDILYAIIFMNETYKMNKVSSNYLSYAIIFMNETYKMNKVSSNYLSANYRHNENVRLAEATTVALTYKYLPILWDFILTMFMRGDLSSVLKITEEEK